MKHKILVLFIIIIIAVIFSVFLFIYQKNNTYNKSELKEVCEKNNISILSLREDKYINLDELIINISVPKNDFYEDENDYSLITSVELGGKKMLFMGDACKIRCSEYAENINEKYIF